jgi:hypothetical protein
MFRATASLAADHNNNPAVHHAWYAHPLLDGGVQGLPGLSQAFQPSGRKPQARMKEQENTVHAIVEHGR